MFYSFQADFYMGSVNGIDRGYLNIGFYFAQGTVSYNLVKLSILTLVIRVFLILDQTFQIYVINLCLYPSFDRSKTILDTSF